MADSRQRFVRRQWARRWRNWRVLLVGALVVVLLGVGGWFVLFSDTLSVRGVEVSGTRTLADDRVREVAEVPTGGPLATVDLDAISFRVRALAVVKSAEVSRKWPDRVLIELVERTPVAVVEIGGRLHSLDEEGVVFGSYRRPPADLPRVRAGADVGANALAEGAQVVAALPDDLAAQVDHARVETADLVLLQLRDGREVRWGSADQSEQKAEVLVQLLAARPGASTYDVSVPGQPTVK